MRLELFVEDLDVSVDFYTRILGFAVTGTDEATGYTALELEGNRIALQAASWLPEGHPMRAAGAKGVGVEIVVPVAEVAQRHAAALRVGADVTDLVAQPWGLTDFRIQDPDGFYLRLTSRRS